MVMFYLTFGGIGARPPLGGMKTGQPEDQPGYLSFIAGASFIFILFNHGRGVLVGM